MGKVAVIMTEIVESKDDIVRKCTVHYENFSEDTSRYTASKQQEVTLTRKLIEEVNDEKD